MSTEAQVFELQDPFALPDDAEITHSVHKPKWWYAKQLRMAGVSTKEIAEALGYKSELAVETEIRKNRPTKAMYQQSVEEIVELELDRLDALQVICWRAIQQGDLKLILTVLAIMQMRMKLLGTEKRTHEGDTTTNTAIFIGGDTDEYKDALRKARELVRKTEAIEA